MARTPKQENSCQGLPPSYQLAILAAGLLLILDQTQAGVTVTARGVDFASVKSAVAKAADGDIVVTPAGTAAWTSTLVINKSISLIGAGIDQTIFIDQTPKGTGHNCLFQIESKSNTILSRISGFTINGSDGGSTGSTIDKGGLGAISIAAVSANPNVRVDHIKFYRLYQRPLVFSGGAWGVVDHCDFTMGPWTGGIEIKHDSWKGRGNYGDNSWADEAHFGTEQAMFIEDCTFTEFSGATFVDGDAGMRVVVRHCTVTGSEMGNHGTETSQRYRGGRMMEVYKNTMDGGDSSHNHNWAIYVRGGTALIWGNTLDRYDRIVNLAGYRLWFKAQPWGQADGANVWDVNDTEDHSGNGYGGGPSGVFATGTHTGSNGASTLTDSAAAWTKNQWRGYSIRNLTQTTAGSINANTTTTITPDGNPQGAPMTFNSGDRYEIRKVLVVLDQPGRGKGDYISGGSSVVNPTPRKNPNNMLEPVRIWGNTLAPKFGNGNGLPVVTSQAYNLVENVDWYYSIDNSAALPGYSPYVYPHPLVSGTSVTSANLRIAP